MNTKTLDINLKQNNFNRIDIMQGYTLEMQTNIFDGDTPISDLSTFTPSIEMKKADNTVIVQTNGVTIVGNRLSVICHKSFTAISGNALLQIVLTKGGLFYGSWVIDVAITKSAVTQNDEVSKNVATVIEELRLEIQKAEKTKVDLNNLIATGETKTKEYEKRVDVAIAKGDGKIAEYQTKVNENIAKGNANIEQHIKDIQTVIDNGQVVKSEDFNPIKESFQELNVGTENYFPYDRLQGYNCTFNKISNINKKTPTYKAIVSKPSVRSNFGYSSTSDFDFICEKDFNFNISFYYNMKNYKSNTGSSTTYPMKSYIKVTYVDNTQETLNILEKNEEPSFNNGVGLNKWTLVKKTFKAKKTIKSINQFYFYTDYATEGTMDVTSPVLALGTSPISWEDNRKETNTMRVRRILGANENLNDCTETGVYCQNDNASASSGQNYPTPRAGNLEVINSISMIYQTYTTYDKGQNKVYVRSYYSGWGAWTDLTEKPTIDTGNIPTVTSYNLSYTGALNNGTVYNKAVKIGNLVYLHFSIVDLHTNTQMTSYANFTLPFSFVDWASFTISPYKINGSTTDHWNICKMLCSGSPVNGSSRIHINTQGVDMASGTVQSVGISGLAVLILS